MEVVIKPTKIVVTAEDKCDNWPSLFSTDSTVLQGLELRLGINCCETITKEYEIYGEQVPHYYIKPFTKDPKGFTLHSVAWSSDLGGAFSKSFTVQTLNPTVPLTSKLEIAGILGATIDSNFEGYFVDISVGSLVPYFVILYNVNTGEFLRVKVNYSPVDDISLFLDSMEINLPEEILSIPGVKQVTLDFAHKYLDTGDYATTVSEEALYLDMCKILSKCPKELSLEATRQLTYLVNVLQHSVSCGSTYSEMCKLVKDLYNILNLPLDESNDCGCGRDASGDRER